MRPTHFRKKTKVNEKHNQNVQIICGAQITTKMWLAISFTRATHPFSKKTRAARDHPRNPPFSKKSRAARSPPTRRAHFQKFARCARPTRGPPCSNQKNRGLRTTHPRTIMFKPKKSHPAARGPPANHHARPTREPPCSKQKKSRASRDLPANHHVQTNKNRALRATHHEGDVGDDGDDSWKLMMIMMIVMMMMNPLPPHNSPLFHPPKPPGPRAPPPSLLSANAGC